MSLDLKNIDKTYRSGFGSHNDCIALSDVSFSIPSGSVLALIGQNGAGKTTLIKCLMEFIHLDRGEIRFNENKIGELKQNNQIGYMPETVRFPGLITLKEYIDDLLVLRGLKIEDYQQHYSRLIQALNMAKHEEKILTQCSKGTMKKAAFIQAVLHCPALLVLDEPTDGLDPVSRRALLNEVSEMKRNGSTVIITTHLLSDLSLVADQVVVLQNGRLIQDIPYTQIETSLDDWYLQTLLEHGELDKL